MNSKKIYDLKEARLKIEQYCVYQDRCHMEVEKKLKSYGLNQESIDFLMELLIEDKFVNEERYARAFTRGSYRHKKWGWNKIKMNLKQKQIGSYCIKQAFKEIDQTEYREMIGYQLQKKWSGIKGDSSYEKEVKLTRFGISRGYEYEIIQMCIEDIRHLDSQ